MPIPTHPVGFFFSSTPWIDLAQRQKIASQRQAMRPLLRLDIHNTIFFALRSGRMIEVSRAFYLPKMLRNGLLYFVSFDDIDPWLDIVFDMLRELAIFHCWNQFRPPFPLQEDSYYLRIRGCFMNMTCANKDCGAELKYLRGGRLFLMERQPSAQATSPESWNCANAPECGSFESPAMSMPSQGKPTVMMRRYFWLCERCAQMYTIRRWTENGIELAPRSKRVQAATAVLPHEWTLPGLVG